MVAGAVLVPARAEAQAGEWTNCTIGGQNQFVRRVMFDYYLWYDTLPTTNPIRFASPEAYLEAIRYRPLDRTFSYITSRREQEALYSASQYVGLGFSSQYDGVRLRISQTFPSSPASDAGIRRGDVLTAIDGRTVASLAASGDLSAAFGAAAEGVAVDLTWTSADGSERRARLTKRAVVIPTVGDTRLYQVDGRRVGYIFFRNFVEPSVPALDAAFAALRDGGATELVLDLRYNGGGLVAVAQHLASLIGGSATAGQVFAEFFHNDKQTARNQAFRFQPAANALGLSRLVVITTRASASASELLINALRPFMPVQIVGDTTYGKPVGQYGFTFCDKVLNPVSFVVRNADGENDYFNGFPADCRAADDLDRDLGDPAEASLREAFTWLRTGACGSSAPASGFRTRMAPQPILEEGWAQIVGAH